MHAKWINVAQAGSGNQPPGLYGHSLNVLSDGHTSLVVVFGGTKGEGINAQSDAVWTWSPAASTDGWAEVNIEGPRPRGRGWHGAAVLDHNLYIFGGNRYDKTLRLHAALMQVFCTLVSAHPGTHCASSCAGPHLAACDVHHLCRWYQDDAQKPVREVFADLWKLDTQQWQWTQLSRESSSQTSPSRPCARSACGMTCAEEHLLVFGGKSAAQDSSAYLADLWMYNVSSPDGSQEGHWCD